MKKFTSIESLKNVVNFVKYKYGETLPTITYVGTVKLHGCNAGIRYTGENYIAQGRNKVLSIDSDNYGFAKWLSKIPTKELDLLFGSHKIPNFTLFGEWIGPGIQKKVGITNLPSKQFVIFNAHDGDNYVGPGDFANHNINVHNITEIPGYEITIDFNKPSDAVRELNQLTLSVADECPWAKHFGITGRGEGIVWVPKNMESDSDLFFKTKGKSHKPTNEKSCIPLTPEMVEAQNKAVGCVDIILGVGRLEQGWNELFEKTGIDPYMKHLGDFIKWVGQDCKKEEMDTITANGLTWKDVSKHITEKAKQYFIERLDNYE